METYSHPFLHPLTPSPVHVSFQYKFVFESDVYMTVHNKYSLQTRQKMLYNFCHVDSHKKTELNTHLRVLIIVIDS